MFDHPLFLPGLVIVAAIAGCILFVWAMTAANKRRREHVMTNGETVKAWLVQANNALFQPQEASPGFGLPAQFLISFDESAADSPEVMQGLAKRMTALKGKKPSDPAERKVAKLVTDETYRPGCRDRLPESFTGGPVVYAVHVVVEPARLPAKRIDRPYIYCKAIPGDSGWVFMVDYPPGG
jgi:hypothetical protein